MTVYDYSHVGMVLHVCKDGMQLHVGAGHSTLLVSQAMHVCTQPLTSCTGFCAIWVTRYAHADHMM